MTDASQVQTGEGLDTDGIDDLSTASNSLATAKRESSQSARPSLQRKHSHEEMNATLSNENESSMRGSGGDDDASMNRDSHTWKVADRPSAKPLAAAAAAAVDPGAMPPPPIPASKSESAAQQPPPSGQGSTVIGDGLKRDVFPEPQLGNNVTWQGPLSDTAQVPESIDDGAPHKEIGTFDWHDLEERYHAKVQELDTTEQGIMDEFSSLCNYFSIWAQAGTNREVDRSFKRLKTQMTLVRHHEDELEKKRLHYIKVVDAFQSALQLLST